MEKKWTPITHIFGDNILRHVFFLIVLLSCTDLHNDDYILFVTKKHFQHNLALIIPVFEKGNKINILTDVWSVNDRIYKKYSNFENETFSNFTHNLINGKIKIAIEKYNLNYSKVIDTNIYDEYSRKGINFIIKKYFRKGTLSKIGGRKYYLLDDTPGDKRNDLIRIMFDNEFLIIPSDITSDYIFIKY